VPELVEDGTSGLLVPAHAPEALAAAVLTLADDDALRRRLGAGSAARGASVDGRAAVERIEERYTELATRRHTAGR
jgi:glycosyltransferase involved in cell wall biosynthesis